MPGSGVGVNVAVGSAAGVSTPAGGIGVLDRLITGGAVAGATATVSITGGEGESATYGIEVDKKPS